MARIKVSEVNGWGNGQKSKVIVLCSKIWSESRSLWYVARDKIVELSGREGWPDIRQCYWSGGRRRSEPCEDRGIKIEW